MNIDFRKNLRNSYMVISDHSFSSQDSYPFRMLAKECPEGLLSLSLEHCNGCVSFLYDITSKHSFEKIFETKNFNADMLKSFLRSLKNIVTELEKFLLDPDDLVLAPDTIYTDFNASAFYFCYCPEYDHDCAGQLKALSNRMLNLADYDDAAAVKLCFEFNKKLHSESFSLRDLDELFSDEPGYLHKRIFTGNISDTRFADNMFAGGTSTGRFTDYISAGNTPAGKAAGNAAAGRSPGSRPAGKAEDNIYISSTADGMPARKTKETAPVRDPAEKNSGKSLSFSKKAKIYFRDNSFSRIFEDFNSWKLLKKIRAVEDPVRVPDIPVLQPEEKRIRFEPYIQTVQEPLHYPEETVSGEEETVLLGDTSNDLMISETAGTEKDVSPRYSIERISGTKHEITRMTVLPFTIGKSADACSLRIDVPTVSRLHARIYKNPEDPETLEFEDLNSRNGSFINGAPVPAYTRFPVRNGDTLRLANVEFLVHIK